MKTTKVDTWLPIFSGFYGTIWESDNDEEMEIESINESRKEKGLEPITWDDIEWDYEGYSKAVVNGVTSFVGDELKKLGMVKDVKLEKLYSPREYNFSNDAIYVTMTVTDKTKLAVKKYLEANREEFGKYLKDRYTSYSGFFSSHSNAVEDWLEDLEKTLTDTHKLGSVLQFILENEDKDLEEQIYEKLHCNGTYVTASNYSDLVPEKAGV